MSRKYTPHPRRLHEPTPAEIERLCEQFRKDRPRRKVFKPEKGWTLPLIRVSQVA